MKSLLEVIVISVEDAVAASEGGAGRLEIISNFAVGGLTPAVQVVKEIQAAVSTPLRVMLRTHEGFELANQQELEMLCQKAKQFADLGVDGLVLGFLRDGEVDFGALQEILSCAPNLRATFHRAFEVLKDPFQTIESLKEFKQIDRILTSGGLKPWQRNLEFLEALQRCAAPEITILVGGGLDMRKVESLCTETELREFHLGRAVRHPEQIDGVVSAEKVKAIKRILP